MPTDPHIDAWAFNRYQDLAFLLSTGFLIIAVTAVVLVPGWLTILLFLASIFIWGVIVYFFRDPDREVVNEPGLVVGPADGVVVAIEKLFDEKHLDADVVRVSMFLSVWDVHVQRMPLAGKVLDVAFKPGKYLRAILPDASEVNEYIAMSIETDYGRLVVKQISGIMARRCVNYAHPGDLIATGQRFGLIKFGSRVDLFLPLTAEILVKVGDKVSGGLTRIAQL